MRSQRAIRCAALLVLLGVLTACNGTARVSPSPTPGPPTASPVPPQTPLPSATPTLRPATAVPSPTPTPTITPTRTPTPTPTRDPYAGVTIADLSARSYGGGAITVKTNWGFSGEFTRYEITYPSDGLTIYGFMNVPAGQGPFPVVVMLHGYIDPSRYDTLDYTTHYADSVARAGYVVLHPNLRGFPPSDTGPADRFGVGRAVDVLNLIAILRAQARQPGPLQSADPDAIGLWGHSMGGGISVRVLTVSEALGFPVKAAVLYAAMSGDERQNAEWARARGRGTRMPDALLIPQADLDRISPIHFLERVRAAVSIHHSVIDPTVPYEWSEQLCMRLQVLRKPVECFSYSDQPHTFGPAGNQLFVPRTIALYDKYLKGKP